MVLETSAVFAYLRDEPEAEAIEDALAGAPRRHISALTLFECRTVFWGRFGLTGLGELDQFLLRTRPRVHPLDGDQATLAFAAYRHFGKGTGHPAQLNLCDCAAYALATSLDLPLLFKGNDFGRTDVRAALA
jgi:ribonuclease VapC